MKKREIMEWLWEDVGIVIMGFINEDYHPDSRVVEIIHGDEQGVYFFFREDDPLFPLLIREKKISITGLLPGSSPEKSEFVKLTGEAEYLGERRKKEFLDDYPEKRKLWSKEEILSKVGVFALRAGSGIYHDKKGTVKEFSFGNTGEKYQYKISNRCIRCMECVRICPVKAIRVKGVRCEIDQALCIHCGACYNTCAFGAIERF